VHGGYISLIGASNSTTIEKLSVIGCNSDGHIPHKLGNFEAIETIIHSDGKYIEEGIPSFIQ
jgi:hypothetical protein